MKKIKRNKIHELFNKKGALFRGTPLLFPFFIYFFDKVTASNDSRGNYEPLFLHSNNNNNTKKTTTSRHGADASCKHKCAETSDLKLLAASLINCLFTLILTVSLCCLCQLSRTAALKLWFCLWILLIWINWVENMHPQRSRRPRKLHAQVVATVTQQQQQAAPPCLLKGVYLSLPSDRESRLITARLPLQTHLKLKFLIKPLC